MQIQFHERGYIGTGPWKGLTRFEEVDQGSSADMAGIKQGDLIVAIDDLLLLEDEYHARALTIEEWRRFDELTRYGKTPLVTVCRGNNGDIRKQDGELITARLTSVPIALRYRTYAAIFFISNFICLGFLLFFLAGKSSILPARLFCFCLVLNWAGIFSQIFSSSKIFVVVQILSLFSLAIATHIFLIWPSTHPIKKRFPSSIIWIYCFYALFLFSVIFMQLKSDYFFNYRFLEIFAAISFVMVIAIVLKQNRIGNNQQRQKIGWFSLICP